MISCGSNDLSVLAESNDTHYDHDIKIFGSRLGRCTVYVTSVKNTRKSCIIGKTHKVYAHDYIKFFRYIPHLDHLPDHHLNRISMLNKNNGLFNIY